jgi:3-oxoacid CoA-transferase
LCSIIYEHANRDVKETIIAAIARRGVDSLHSLTAVSNNAGAAGGGGLSPLVQSGQIDRLILSFLGTNKSLEEKYLSGKIAIELCPQGTIAERIRAGGAGIPAFFTPTGVSKWRDIFELLQFSLCARNLGREVRKLIDVPLIADTLLQSGEIPVRLGPIDKATKKSTILEAGKPRETRIFDGKVYNMETAIKADVAIIRAHKVDEEGNVQFR